MNEWITVSVEEFHELVIGAEGELLSTEGFADDFVIGEDDHELGAEPQTENGSVAAGQSRQLLVKVAADVGQVADQRQSARTRRKRAPGVQPAVDAHRHQQRHQHQQRVHQTLRARGIHQKAKTPRPQSLKTPDNHLLLLLLFLLLLLLLLQPINLFCKLSNDLLFLPKIPLWFLVFFLNTLPTLFLFIFLLTVGGMELYYRRSCSGNTREGRNILANISKMKENVNQRERERERQRERDRERETVRQRARQRGICV